MEKLNKNVIKKLLYKYVAMHPDYHKLNETVIDHQDFDKLCELIVKDYYNFLLVETAEGLTGC